jgi:hypothetical protein
MLANKDTVVNIVKALSDMRGSAYFRRIWNDKNRTGTARYLTFKFWDAAEADRVADKLQKELAAEGYTNLVKRTSVEFWSYAGGGEYVRVKSAL